MALRPSSRAFTLDWRSTSWAVPKAVRAESSSARAPGTLAAATRRADRAASTSVGVASGAKVSTARWASACAVMASSSAFCFVVTSTPAAATSRRAVPSPSASSRFAIERRSRDSAIRVRAASIAERAGGMSSATAEASIWAWLISAGVVPRCAVRSASRCWSRWSVAVLTADAAVLSRSICVSVEPERRLVGGAVHPRHRRRRRAVVATVQGARVVAEAGERALELGDVLAAVARTEVPVHRRVALEDEHRPAGHRHHDRALAQDLVGLGDLRDQLRVRLQRRRREADDLRLAVAPGPAHDDLARQRAPLHLRGDQRRRRRRGVGRDLRRGLDLLRGDPATAGQEHDGGQRQDHDVDVSPGLHQAASLAAACRRAAGDCAPAQ